MSVIIETTIGDITVDLFLKERPRTCLNFLKLCKTKYYNYCVFHSVQRNFVAQTGDPTGAGRGGESIFQSLYGDQARYFDAEVTPKIKHRNIGTISMVNDGNGQHGSQFLITLGENLDYLDGVHTVFGEVAEGFDVLTKLNEAFCDKENRPYKDIRITHTVILDDPLDDPPGLIIPDRSPEPTKEQLESLLRIGADEEIDDTKGLTEGELAEREGKVEAEHQAQVLEIIGDLPDKDVKPPDNVLFICKLNPVTTDEDLEIIFSRFGKILSCEIIRDFKTSESLQYAFIEFDKPDECEKAYLKMDNVLIDDRRIHVDFSQSVSKIQYRRSNDPKLDTSGKKDKVSHKNSSPERKHKKEHKKRERIEEQRGQNKNYRSNGSSDNEVRCGKHRKRRSHSPHKKSSKSVKKHTRSPSPRKSEKHSKYEKDNYSRHRDDDSGYKKSKHRKKHSSKYD
uniref:peptidyl-prolyl cis-trans isomerase-like 4 n=1 Tax=Styela clava TaxID=7725 RepID=UPI00193A1427|nr:peptidyl-prolyl cis-trans isomerase-like 4 [Styela clava]